MLHGRGFAVAPRAGFVVPVIERRYRVRTGTPRPQSRRRAERARRRTSTYSSKYPHNSCAFYENFDHFERSDAKFRKIRPQLRDILLQIVRILTKFREMSCAFYVKFRKNRQHHILYRYCNASNAFLMRTL